jgi:hypothetical protein
MVFHAQHLSRLRSHIAPFFDRTCGRILNYQLTPNFVKFVFKPRSSSGAIRPAERPGAIARGPADRPS